MNRNSIILTLCGAFAVLALTFLFKASRDNRSEKTAQQNSQAASGPQSPTPSATKATAPMAEPIASKHAPGPSIPNVSSPVLTAIGKGEHQDFRRRLQAISQLGTNLSAEDRQALYAYLRDTGEEKWLRPGQNFALKNDILNVLREQQLPPAELTDVLIALRQDASQPPVMRDYALQHLAPWYARVDGDQEDKIVKELQAASEEIDQSYAGTALLALHRLQRENPGTQTQTLPGQILRLIEDGNANLLARISAVQLSGQLRLPKALESVRRLAVDESQPKTLRVAAMGAIGRAGRMEDAPLLTKSAQSDDGPLKRAATVALRNLRNAGEN